MSADYRTDGYDIGEAYPETPSLPRRRSQTSVPARGSAASDPPSTADSNVDSPIEPPLSARIERTRLRLQVAALERALERSEYRRQTVIDRYERLLEDRESSADEEPAPETHSGSSLTRLLGT